jgi:HK97 family phage portal protein
MTWKKRIKDWLLAGTETRSDPDQYSVLFGEFLKSDGNVVVGYTRLSDNPEVQTCVGVIADFVSDMTIHLMANTKKGDVRIINELSRKIDINPCGNMTRKHFISWIVKTMLIEGNAIVYPEYTREGLIKDLRPVSRRGVRFEKNGKSYVIIRGDKKYDPDEVLHFVFNPDIDNPWKGRGFTVELRDVIQTLAQSSATKREFLTNQFRPSIIVGVQALAGELTSEEGRIEIGKKFGLETQDGKPWIVPAGVMDVHQVKPLTLTDLAINDNVVLDKKTVAGLFGVPAYYLGVGEFNEKEHNSFIRTRVMSVAMIIQQTLTKGLLLSPELYFRFNPRSLYSYSLGELATVGGNLSSRGIMSGNEVRDWIGLSPRDGLDELTILENFIKLEDIGKQLKLLQEGE